MRRRKMLLLLNRHFLWNDLERRELSGKSEERGRAVGRLSATWQKLRPAGTHRALTQTTTDPPRPRTTRSHWAAGCFVFLFTVLSLLPLWFLTCLASECDFSFSARDFCFECFCCILFWWVWSNFYKFYAIFVVILIECVGWKLCCVLNANVALALRRFKSRALALCATYANFNINFDKPYLELSIYSFLNYYATEKWLKRELQVASWSWSIIFFF